MNNWTLTIKNFLAYKRDFKQHKWFKKNSTNLKKTTAKCWRNSV